MRVGLLIYGTLDARSGGYLYDLKLVEHLRANGDAVEIVSLPYRDYLRHLGDNYSRSLKDRLERLAVDVLIQDELNHPSLFDLNRRLRPRVAYPIIGLVHHLRLSEAHPAWQMGLYRVVERAYLRSVDGFIYNSRTTRAVVLDQLGHAAPGVVAVPGKDNVAIEVDAAAIAARAAAPGPVRIVFVGNLVPRKGLHVLLAALAGIKDLDWTLRVIGSPDADPKYAHSQKSWAQDVFEPGRIEFTGFVPADRMAGYLHEAHLFAGPSQYEGYGIAYLEALGAGLAVIASMGGAAGEFIRDGENGFLVEPENPEGLAVVLRALLTDRTRIAAMGQAAQRSFAQHPGWAESMAAARDFLKQAAAGEDLRLG